MTAQRPRLVPLPPKPHPADLTQAADEYMMAAYLLGCQDGLVRGTWRGAVITLVCTLVGLILGAAIGTGVWGWVSW